MPTLQASQASAVSDPPVRSIEDLPGPWRLPGLGNALRVRSGRLHLEAERWCREYGPLFRFDLGARPVIGVGDTAAINQTLRERPERFRRWKELGTILNDHAAPGVFSAEGNDWRRQRRLAVTALNADHLHRYFDVIRNANERLHARLTAAAQAGRPFAIEQEFKTFTVEVTSALAFGRDLEAPVDAGVDLRPHIDRVFETMGRRLAAPVPYWRWLKLPADRALDRSAAVLRAAVNAFIEEALGRMAERPELHDEPENFLEGMLAAQAREGRFSEEELFGNTLTMLLAGEDTTAVTLAWTSWFLARDPDVQARLASEARRLIGDHPYPLEHDAAAGFAYGEAVLRESIRLKPAATMILVEPLEDVILADVRVPAGTRLLLLTRHAGLQEANFTRPEVFDPDRWLGDAKGAHDPKGFLAFGAGPRFCPGRNLAFLEAKAALAMLARNFELSLDPTAKPVTERFTFTMTPRGLRVRLRPRALDERARLPNATRALASGGPQRARSRRV